MVDSGDSPNEIEYIDYKDESQLDDVMQLVTQDLSEPYSSKFKTVFFFLKLRRTRNFFSLFSTNSFSSLPFTVVSKVFTYRYFLSRFPELCILAVDSTSGKPIGCVVGKIDREEVISNGQAKTVPTGYIGMLAVQSSYRRKSIGQTLVRKVLERMKDKGCQSVTLETEMSNTSAQRLYQQKFGFIREEKLVRYYLNWGDAYRLRLWF